MNSKLTIRDMALLAIMGALMFASQVVMASLPNIHIVALLIILTTFMFGWKALYSVGIFVLLEGLMYGFGPWWIGYLYTWPLLVVVTVIFRANTDSLFWAVVSGLHGLFFGALCAIPQIFILGAGGALAWWISGIPFDLLHCAGNFVIALVLIKPLRSLTEKLMKQ
ncbi:MAG: hypothetical protein Q4A83_00895 [Bacillota bacterium]|nr:hypothetical protein [Bacillota bacterium]